MLAELLGGSKCFPALLTFVLIGLSHAFHLLSFGSVPKGNRHAVDLQHGGHQVVAGFRH